MYWMRQSPIPTPQYRDVIRGIPLNPEGSTAAYTAPTIRLPDGSLVVDSQKIAEFLDRSYSNRPLHLDPKVHDQVTQAVSSAAGAVLGDFLYHCMRNCLSDMSAANNRETRQRTFGMNLEEFAVKKGGESVWQAAEAVGGPFERLKAHLAKHKLDDGPVVLGSTVSYGDFVAAGFFECFSRADLTSYV